MKIKAIDRKGNVMWFAGFIDTAPGFSLTTQAHAAIDTIGADQVVKKFNKSIVAHGYHFAPDKQDEDSQVLSIGTAVEALQ